PGFRDNEPLGEHRLLARRRKELTMSTRLWAIPLALAGLAIAAFAGVVVAENIDPFNNGSQYAWSENTGWLNAEPANCGNCGVQVSNTKLTGYIWAENIGWISFSDTSPVAYQVQTSDDDADRVFAGSDNCPNWPNPAQNLPPWPVPANDPDCDGFSTAVENSAGTSPTTHCGANAWPADINNDGFSDISDVSALTGVF